MESTAVASINRMRSQVRGEREARESCQPTIHRVRRSIRDGDPWAYEPQVVAIGPFHHGKSSLEEMEELKYKFLDDLLLRSSAGNQLQKYFDAVRSTAARARAQYAGKLYLTGDVDFEVIMTVDGCFVVECLVKWRAEELGKALESVSCYPTLLRNDLLLLENQIPFFILEKLYGVSNIAWQGDPRSPPTLQTLAEEFLKIHHLPEDRTHHHLLDLLHSSLDPCVAPSRININVPEREGAAVPSGDRSTKEQPYPKVIPCATELEQAGIRFKMKRLMNGDKSSFLMVSFEKGTLEMPYLSVEESTGSRFRNLVAFELCCPTVGDYFTSYAIFMCYIINTAADVPVLRRHGIIGSKLGCDKQVAGIFNTACKGSHLNYRKHYLKPLFLDVKNYCKVPRHRWRASAVQDYCSSPCATISLIAASALLLFTSIHTLFVVLGYFSR